MIERDDFSLPIVIFYVKTHTNLFISLATFLNVSIICVINVQCNVCVKCWRPLGYVLSLFLSKDQNDTKDYWDKLEVQPDHFKEIFGFLLRFTKWVFWALYSLRRKALLNNGFTGKLANALKESLLLG